MTAASREPGGRGTDPGAHRGAAATPQALRLAVGVIGAGRVGAVLGAALARAGHRIVGTTAVSRESRARAERLLPQVPVLAAEEVADRAELVLLAVPDDTLPELVAGLATTGGWRPGQLVAHTSGAHGVAVLEPAARHGAYPIALHPVMTFAGRPEDVERLSGVAFGVTVPGDDPEGTGAAAALRLVAEALVLEMGGEPVWIPEAARPLYHTALTAAANHLVTLVNDAAALLAGAGVAAPPRLLAPLLEASLDNALRLGDAGLTGPVSRGDAGTVAAHLDQLRRAAPEMVGSYVAMARRTADRALASGRLAPHQAESLLDVLAHAGGDR